MKTLPPNWITLAEASRFYSISTEYLEMLSALGFLVVRWEVYSGAPMMFLEIGSLESYLSGEVETALTGGMA